MLEVEQADQVGSGGDVYTFGTEEWNSVSKMDLDKLDFPPSSNRQQRQVEKIVHKDQVMLSIDKISNR